ncbi:unnamed protein product, partial [Closterium sp. NIES-53]
RLQRGAADLGKGEMLLTCYTDASFNSVKADGTSIGGYVCLFGGGAVSWRSKKQNEVGLSSCETEYMALHHGAKEMVWLRRLLEEIGVCQKEPTVIFCDESAVIFCEAKIYAGAMAAQELRWLTYLLTDLGEPPRSPPTTKHIALWYFLARELQQRGQLRLAYVASRANTAYIFTKALQPCDHQRFCTMLACCAFLDWSCDLLFSPTLPIGFIPFLFLHTGVIQWLDEGVVSFLKPKFDVQSRSAMLVFDSYRGHLTKEVKARFAALNIVPAVILAGCTADVQPLDVSVNKSFKASVCQQYQSWFEANGMNILTPTDMQRHVKPPSAVVLKWISRAWKAVPADLIKKAFLTCVISNALDGSEDHLAMAHRRSQLSHEVEEDDGIQADRFWGNNTTEPESDVEEEQA